MHYEGGDHFPITADLANVRILLSRWVGSDGKKGVEDRRQADKVGACLPHHRLAAQVVELEEEFSVVMCRLPNASVIRVLCSSSCALAEPVAGVALAARLMLRSLGPTRRRSLGARKDSAPMLAGSS